MSNYDDAKKEADLVDQRIIETLISGKSFKVEAGAGAGKTYSLHKVIDWVKNNKLKEIVHKKQQIICITYTNAAVDVITSRLGSDPFVIPATIHSFAWSCIKQYQSTLLNFLVSFNLLPNDCKKEDIKIINYNLGKRYFENGELFLFHDDVITLFNAFLDSEKFRKIFSEKYPLILIDEYQDSFKLIIEKFIKYFIDEDKGPQFGFFGDSWQTIYGSNGACGEIINDKIISIKKGVNFRSPKLIVDVLNNIRPNLPQKTAIDKYDGRVLVITNDDYTGPRQTGSHYGGELPNDEFILRTNNAFNKCKSIFNWEENNSKMLMLTHRSLAQQQQYSDLFNIFGSDIVKTEDKYLSLFLQFIEPLYFALESKDTKLLFTILGVKRYPITSKQMKLKWNALYENLKIARTKKIRDVMDVVFNCDFLPINPIIIENQQRLKDNEEITYYQTNLNSFEEINYSQVISLSVFIKPLALYSTEHGVKGEEYDNVMFIVGRGWNQYKFDEYLTKDPLKLNTRELASYERNRNLFYVCCSRPMKELVLFITFPTNAAFKNYLNIVFGLKNVVAYNEFIGL